MYTCTACGSNIPDNKRFCPQCGAMTGAGSEYVGQSSATTEFFEDYEYMPPGAGPQSRRDYGRAAANAPRYQPDPTYNYMDPAKDPQRVLGTGEFFFSILLMLLPVIGFILQIVWACGGTRSRNRVNLARAYLIYSILGAILLAAGIFLILEYVLPLLDMGTFYFT